MTWASGGAADMRAYPSFTAYLVHKAEASQSEDSDIDNPEQVVFHIVVVKRETGVHDDNNENSCNDAFLQ